MVKMEIFTKHERSTILPSLSGHHSKSSSMKGIFFIMTWKLHVYQKDFEILFKI